MYKEYDLNDTIFYNGLYYCFSVEDKNKYNCAICDFDISLNSLYIPHKFTYKNNLYYVTHITFLFYRKLLDFKQQGIYIDIDVDNDNAYIKKYKDAIYTVYYYTDKNDICNQCNTLLYYINPTKSNYYYIDKYADSIYLESLLVDKNINYIEIERDYERNNLSSEITPLSGFIKNNNIIYIKNKDRNLLYYNNKFKII